MIDITEQLNQAQIAFGIAVIAFALVVIAANTGKGKRPNNRHHKS